MTNQQNKINATLNKVIDIFESGNLPKTIAHTFFPTFDLPCGKWSLLNRLLVAIEGTCDARGIRQWNSVGRKVKKGAKSFSILAPKTKKITKQVKRAILKQ